MNLKFDHVHYRASSFAATRRFYVDVMEAEDLGPVLLNGKEHLQLRLGGVDLLFAPADSGAVDPGNDRLGAFHIALHVTDCDAAFAHYVERGARVAKEPFDVSVSPPSPTPSYRVAFLEAPDGMQVELKEDVG